LKLVTKNIMSGDTEQIIFFNCWDEPNKGFNIQKQVKFVGLMKNQYDPEPFSKSMLKKIKELKEQNGEKEQTAILDHKHTEH
jgi:hypothetical protein